MEFKGILKQVLDFQTGTSKNGKTWQKQEFLVETLEQYPQSAVFNLFGDKTDLIQKLTIGVAVNVHFNLNSKEYNGKFYNSLNAWKIDKVGNVTVTDTDTFNEISESAESAFGDIPATDDLPF